MNPRYAVIFGEINQLRINVNGQIQRYINRHHEIMNGISEPVTEAVISEISRITRTIEHFREELRLINQMLDMFRGGITPIRRRGA